MKKLLVIAAAAAALLSAPVTAADLPRKAPVYKAAKWDWTGWYIGGHAGYAWGKFTSSDDPFFDGVKGKGGFGGGQIGYNWQFGDPWVFGLEADIALANIKGNQTALINGCLAAPCLVPLTGVATLDYFGTARARLGPSGDRWYLYGTGGLAWAHGKGSISFPGTGGLGLPAFAFTDDNIHFGYAVGAGFEWAVANNISWKIEYLYLDFGEKVYFSGTGANAKVGWQGSTVKVGLNWLFPTR